MVNYSMKIIAMYQRLSAAQKSAIWVCVCSVLQKGIAFITVPIFTRIMPQADYGMYQVYQSWFSFLLVFTSLNLSAGSFNKAMINYAEDKDRYLSAIQGLTTVITFIWFVVFLFCSDIVSDVLTLPKMILLVMFVELCLEPAYLLWAARKRFDYSYKSLVLVTLGISVLIPSAGVVAVYFSEEKGYAKIISGAVAACLIYVLIYIRNLRRGGCVYDGKYWKYALAFNLPLIPHYLSMTALSQADRLMINSMCGSEEAAIYSIASNVSLVLVIVVNALNSAIIPWQYRLLKEKKIEPIRKCINLIIILSVVVVLLPIALAPELVAILAPASYYEAIWIVPPIAVSTFFILLYSLCCNVEFYFEKRKMVMIASVVAALINIVTNYLFIPRYGYMAAGYTTVISYILLAVFHCIFMEITAKKNGYSRLYDFKVMLIASITVGSLAALAMLLYSMPWIRYMIIVGIAVVAIVYRAKIMSLVKMITTKE